MADRSKLTTEQRNPRSVDLDQLSTLGIVSVIQDEDRRIAAAVRRERKRIADAVDIIVDRLRSGGRLIYVGAGTSGRLGVLDASECPPTFGTRPSMVQGIIAGGRRALVRSVEGAEDQPAQGIAAIDRLRVSRRDVVCGIAASGVTPFVLAAMKRAGHLGAATLFVTCAPEAAKKIPADIVIQAVVGPEVITGSTRMKAGTATKLVLNTLTTATMVRLGKVHGNLMVDLRATNNKLRDRAERIVMEITGQSRRRVRSLLQAAAGEVKTSVVMHSRGVKAVEARKLLKTACLSLRQAMQQGGR